MTKLPLQVSCHAKRHHRVGAGGRNLLMAAWLALLTPSAAWAVVETFTGADTANPLDLTDGGNYSPPGIPDATTDVLFDSTSAAAAAKFQFGTTAAVANLAAQSLNDTNAFAIVIGNNSSSTSTAVSNATLTLGNTAGQANGVTGAATTDLIYVGNGSNLTIQKANLRNNQTTGNGTLAVTLAQGGDFDVAGTGALTVTSNITGTGLTVNKTGAGTLTLTGGTNTFSVFNMNAGTLATTAATTATTFNVNGGATTISKGSSNSFTTVNVNAGTVGLNASGTGAFGSGATIYLGDTTSGNSNSASVTQGNSAGGAISTANNIVVRAGSTGTLTLGGNGSNNGGLFSGTITLNNNLTLQDSSNSSETFSGVITGSNTLISSSTGGATLSVTGANATSFTGNVVIAAGVLGFNQNSLGQNSTGGTISFTGNGGLSFLGINTQDISGRLQAMSSGVTGTLNVGTNNVTFAATNGLSGLGTYSKLGTGTLTLSAVNNFGGTFNITAGTLNLSHALSLQSATLAVPTTGMLVFDQTVASHAFTLGALSGAGNIVLQDNATTPNAVALTAGGNNATGLTYSGVLSGAGSLTKTGTGTLALTAADTYTGTTAVTGGTLTLSGAGRIVASSGYIATGGTLAVDNSTTVTANRLATVGLTLQNGTYNQTGRTATSTSTSENVGVLTLDSGANSITLTQGTANTTSTTLTASNLVRNNNATLFVRGTTGLGTLASGSNTSTLLTITAPPTATAVGGGGAFSSSTATNISIIPYLVGSFGTTTTNNNAGTFVGYDTTNNSLRVLTSTQYAGSLAGATNNTNVRLTGAGTAFALTAGTYNSLILDEATATASPTYTVGLGGVTLQSGALLFSKSAGTAQNAVFTGDTLQFGTQEGIITNGNGADVMISAPIAGSGGVTFSTYANPIGTATASTISLSGANVYSGTTTINGAVRAFASGVIPAASNLSVGQGGVFDSNGFDQAVGALTGQGTVDNTSAGSFAMLTIGNNNGNGTFTGSLRNSGPFATIALVKTGTGTQILTGANTYNGGTTVVSGALLVNNITGSATGTGDVFVTGSASAATFGGNGTVTGAVMMSDGTTLAPGAAPGAAGTLTTGMLALTDASLLVYDLGTNSDRVNVTGSLTLDGTLTVNALTGFGVGQYELFAYTGTLTDNTLTVGTVPDGFAATVDSTSMAGAVFLNVVAVPEPGTWALIAGCAGVLVAVRARAARRVARA